MWEPPFTGRRIMYRRIMVGHTGSPPVVIQQVIISREEDDGASKTDPRTQARD